MIVMMANLRRTRRHEFLDHTQVLVAYKMPTVAIHSPAVVFCIIAAYGDRMRRNGASGTGFGCGGFYSSRHGHPPVRILSGSNAIKRRVLSPRIATRFRGAERNAATRLLVSSGLLKASGRDHENAAINPPE